MRARSVIDASGTWGQPNPLGRSGLPAPGENAAIDKGLITAPLPAVTGSERDRFAGRHVLVVGAGHSAANSEAELAGRIGITRQSLFLWRTRGLRGLPARTTLDGMAAELRLPYVRVLEASSAP